MEHQCNNIGCPIWDFAKASFGKLIPIYELSQEQRAQFRLAVLDYAWNNPSNGLNNPFGIPVDACDNFTKHLSNKYQHQTIDIEIIYFEEWLSQSTVSEVRTWYEFMKIVRRQGDKETK